MYILRLTLESSHHSFVLSDKKDLTRRCCCHCRRRRPIMNVVNLIITLCICSCAVQVVAGSNRKLKELVSGQNCTNHLQIIDRCSSMATYSYLSPQNPYPLTMTEFKASCLRIGEGIKCLKPRAKCLTSLAKRSVIAYTNARSRHSRRLCANPGDQKSTEFIESAVCVAKTGNKLNLMVENEKLLVSTIQFLSKSTELKWEQRFHQACCAANRYSVKVLKDIESECTKFKTVYEDMINSMIGELLEVACPEKSRLDEICAKLPKLVLPAAWNPTSLTSAGIDLITKLSDEQT